MDSAGLLLDGLTTAAQPQYLLYALLGVFLGTAVGVLPGIGPAMTVALLLPLTDSLDVTASLIMFAGIYYGGMYGGSTTSILLNTPGESASIVTALEGNRMARAGRGSAALATAALGSFVAGTLATVALTFLAPVVVRFALMLGPADYFAIMVVAFVTIGALLGSSPSRGLTSLGAGLFLGLIGTDTLTGQQRFTFGVPILADGIEVVIVAVGLFAVGEALHVASRMRHGPVHVIPVTKGRKGFLSREDFRRSWPAWLRGTAIGFPIGSIPAGGADVSTFLSYSVERRLSKRKEEFGKGAIEGVAGPEAANNAAAAGVLVPLLTLGLPTSATAAIILVAFTSYGIQPGPLLFANEPELVWALIASLYIGNIMLLVLNLPLVGLWVKILQIPRHYLYAGILTFAALGAFATGFTTQDVVMLIVIGFLGFTMRRFGYPVAPMVVALILGPMAEEQLRRQLAISQGDLVSLVSTPFTISAYGVLLVLLALALVLRRRQAAIEAAVATAAGPAPELVPVGADRPAGGATAAARTTPDDHPDGHPDGPGRGTTGGPR